MPKRLIASCLLVVMSLQLVACASSRNVYLADPVEHQRPDVSEGDVVTVYMRDGERHDGQVGAVTEQELVLLRTQYRDQEETRLAITDVASIDVKGRGPDLDRSCSVDYPRGSLFVDDVWLVSVELNRAHRACAMFCGSADRASNGTSQ